VGTGFPENREIRKDTKQAFLGFPTNACLEFFVFAEFSSKTGKATFGNSA
jgi:hypothetical protein